MMTGATLNALGILLGGMLGLIFNRQLATSTQVAVRGIVGIVTVFISLRITWAGISGGSAPALKQLAIVLLALTLGRVIGRQLRIQKLFNQIGQFASSRYAAARPEDPDRFYNGFAVCTLLFCAGPLGVVGSILAGLANDWEPLAIKMVVDGLAAMGFACIFGPGILLSALPVFVFFGTLTIAAQQFGPMLESRHLIAAIVAVGGLLTFCVALIVLELKKLDVADYLPSLVVAPLIAWIWQ